MKKHGLVKRVVRLDSAERALHSFSGAFAGCVMLIAMGMIVYNVFIRYVFRGSAPWAEEYNGYALVLFATLAASYTLVADKHTRVDLVTSHLSKTAAEWLDIAVSVLALPVGIILTMTTWKDAYAQRDIIANTVLRTPQFPIKVFLAIGFGLLTIALISRSVRKLKLIVSSGPKAASSRKDVKEENSWAPD